MGKGSSKGHTPREAKDNLKSTQLLSVIDAISEGPIEGPVDGLKSVLLNSTPVLDSEGNTNISGVTVVFRAGEQEQTPPEGFESSGSETVLGTEVKYDTPITRTITSANIDRLRFTFGVQALVETTSKGDRNPSEVRLLVQIQRNGGWVTEKDITIKGKTTSQYLASVVVDNLPPRPFNIRMRRMTPDSTTDQLQNKTLWSSYTEIIDVKQCYPNTALVGVQVDSEQFGSQQVSRNYHLRGRILQVPSNYNPQTRQYSGIWDGTLKPAYSNNMAWCLWDMLTHPRYGMGKRLGAADVDKWALYIIGQYCDQSVPDGFGGTEPRITCNAYLTTQRKAWDVLSDFCSAMRCMPVWNGQTLTFVQDRPSDKVWTYNRSNVVMPDDGAPFRYSFSALKDRHNAVEVNWIDPNNGWETATELVEDTQAIARYGRNVTKMDAFGCTSRGQAHRAGLWLIKTELLETQTVDFSVGVRLSNRTDSTSQTEAATSLAVSNVMNEVKTKASLDSPVFTGTPMTPTPPDDASGLETVNAAFVRKLLAALVGSSPETLDTLNELAEALGNDPAFSVTIMKMLAGKQPLNPVLTALGSLPSGEDGFPSFSGNGQCSLAPVSEKGKQLLSQSTAEEMCDVLGINGNSGNSAAGGNYGLQSGIYDRTQGRAAVAGSLGFGHIFTKGDVLSFSSKEVLLDWISNATPGRYTVSADCEIIPEVQFTGVIDLFFADEMRNNLTVPLMLKMAVFYGMNGELYRATYDAIHGPSLSEWVKINIDLYDIAKILSMTTNDNYGDPYAGSITLAAFNSRGSTKTASVVRGQYYPGSVLTPVVFSVPEGALSSPKIGLSGTEKHTLPGVYRALSGTPDYTGEGEFIIAAFIRTM